MIDLADNLNCRMGNSGRGAFVNVLSLNQQVGGKFIEEDNFVQIFKVIRSVV